MEKIFLYQILMGSVFMVPADSKEEADEIIKKYFSKNYSREVHPFFEKVIEYKKGSVIKIG